MGNFHRSNGGVRGALQIWGVARRRVEALLEQSGQADEDRGRIATAAEWYLAIWDETDALITRSASLEQRRLLELYYVEQRACQAISAATGFSPKYVQDLLGDCIRTLEQAQPESLEPLLAWRRRYCSACNMAFLDALPGFDIAPRKQRRSAGGGPAPWRTRKADWREVRRILDRREKGLERQVNESCN